MDEVTAVTSSAPWYAWVLVVAFFGFIAYRIKESKKNTGTYTGGIFSGGGGGGKPPTHQK